MAVKKKEDCILEKNDAFEDVLGKRPKRTCKKVLNADYVDGAEFSSNAENDDKAKNNKNSQKKSSNTHGRSATSKPSAKKFTFIIDKESVSSSSKQANKKKILF